MLVLSIMPPLHLCKQAGRQCEWQFLQHVIPGCSELFAPLNVVLTSTFLPAVFGCEVTPCECLLYSLPVQFGGLGAYHLHYTAKFCFSASRDATQVIFQALHGFRSFKVDRHEETVICVHKDIVRQSELYNDELFSTLLPQFNDICHRSMEQAKMKILHIWFAYCVACESGSL